MPAQTIPKKVGLILPALHHEQRAFVEDPHRIVVTTAGSKAGKSFGLSIWLLKEAWNRQSSLNWWCSPTIRQARSVFNLMETWLPPNRVKIHRGDARMEFELIKSDGSVWSRIAFRSADNPASLRGDGVHAAVIDEAAYWDEDSFISVMTTLTRTRGRLRIVSTPKGNNWFKGEWWKGWRENPHRDEFPEYISYRLPTHSNPYVPRDALDLFERTMTQRAYRQEILAEFIDDASSVFANIRESQESLLLEKPIGGVRYVMGADLAKHQDFTTFCVVDAYARKIVYLDRFQDKDWNITIRKMVETARKWNNATLLLDATGGGDVTYDLVKATYPFVDGYNISNNLQKTQLIQKLIFALEKRELKLPKPDIQKTPASRQMATILQRELEDYEYTISPSQKTLYSAPDGKFDDFVIAVALANWTLSEPEPSPYRFRSVAGL